MNASVPLYPGDRAVLSFIRDHPQVTGKQIVDGTQYSNSSVAGSLTRLKKHAFASPAMEPGQPHSYVITPDGEHYLVEYGAAGPDPETGLEAAEVEVETAVDDETTAMVEVEEVEEEEEKRVRRQQRRERRPQTEVQADVLGLIQKRGSITAHDIHVELDLARSTVDKALAALRRSRRVKWDGTQEVTGSRLYGLGAFGRHGGVESRRAKKRGPRPAATVPRAEERSSTAHAGDDDGIGDAQKLVTVMTRLRDLEVEVKAVITERDAIIARLKGSDE